MGTWSKHTLWVLAAAALLFSCQSPSRPSSEEVKQSLVRFYAALEGSGLDVKGPEMGPKPTSFGVKVTEQGNTNDYLPYFTNISVSDSSDWVFRYDGSPTSFQEFYLIANKISAPDNADLYAYAPHIPGATDFTQIPYVLSDQLDLMWASENGVSNRNIAIDGSNKSATFTFQHALSLIALRFKLKNTVRPYEGDSGDTSYHLLEFKVEASSGTLIQKGTLNAYTGVFTKAASDTYTTEYRQVGTVEEPLLVITTRPAIDPSLLEEQEIKIWTEEDGYSIPLYWLVCPDEYYPAPRPTNHYQDGDYVFSFKMYNHQDKTYIPATFTLNAAHLNNGNAGGSLEKGKKYTLFFTVDNNIHFEGCKKDENWTSVTLNYAI